MDPSHFPASSCMDDTDHEQHGKSVPTHSTGTLCITRFQPLNPGSKSPSYMHDKSSDVDDDDKVDESESDGEEMEKDEPEDEISESSSYKNGHGSLSSMTDVSSTNYKPRSFHLERIATDHDIFEDKCGSNQGFKSNKTAKQQYCCEICGRKFNENNALKRHFQVHSGERPYVCYICNKSFTQREHLEFHINNHKKIKLYCEICSQRFKKAEQLSKHLQIHSGEKPYKCNLCSQGFTKSGNLYSHLRSHYLIKPFSCAACQKTFARRQNLKGHLAMAHSLSDETITSVLPQKRKAYEGISNTNTKIGSIDIHKMFLSKHLDSHIILTKERAIGPYIGDVEHHSKPNSNHMVADGANDSQSDCKAEQTKPQNTEINTQLLYGQVNELQCGNSGDHKKIQISQYHTPINGATESQTGSSAKHYETKNYPNNTTMDKFSIPQTDSNEHERKFVIECAGDNVQNSDISKSSNPHVEEGINVENYLVSKDTENKYCSSITEFDLERGIPLSNCSSITEFDLERGIPLSKQPSYPCSYCEQRFSRRSNLKVHIRIHLGVRPFTCPTCKKDFNRKSNLKVHMAKVHNFNNNAITEYLKTYCSNSDNNALGEVCQNNTTEIDRIDAMDAPMPTLSKNVSDNEGQEKHLVPENQGQSCHCTSDILLADKSSDSLNSNNHLLFSSMQGCTFSVSPCQSLSNINQTNENMYLHNFGHYQQLYPTEDTSTYDSTSDVSMENIFLSASSEANLLPYDAQNTLQNEKRSEPKIGSIKNEPIDEEFDLHSHSQMPSKVMENQSESSSNLQDSFTNASVLKMYECEICGHKFSRRGNLMGHYKVHSGIRQFVCPICHKSFTRKSNLRVHLVKIHNMNDEVSAHLSELGKQQETGSAHLSELGKQQETGEDMQEKDALSANSFHTHFNSGTPTATGRDNTMSAANTEPTEFGPNCSYSIQQQNDATLSLSHCHPEK